MSCLFNSLSHFIQKGPQEIRQEICNYLASDPCLIDDLSASTIIQVESGLEIQHYIDRMRSPSTWGGAIEIRGFVSLYGISVHVQVAASGKWIEFPCSAEKSRAYLRWTGGHYDPTTAPC